LEDGFVESSIGKNPHRGYPLPGISRGEVGYPHTYP